MFWPCETRTSTCRNFATISSGLYRFLAITVLLDVRHIPQVGPLQWGWLSQHHQHRTGCKFHMSPNGRATSLQGWPVSKSRIFSTTDDENSRYSESWPLRQ